MAATKKTEPAASSAPAVAPPPRGGRSIPTFARDFPSDPRLDRIVDLFEQGNFFQVRKDVAALLASTEDDALRAAARELHARTEPDRLALYLVALAAILLAVLAGWYWTHPHESAPPPAAAPGPIST